MICSNCGKTVNDGAKFCPFCGTAVTIRPVSVENAQPAPEAPQGGLQTIGPEPGLQTIGPETAGNGPVNVGQPAQAGAAPQVNPVPMGAPVNPQPMPGTPVNPQPVPGGMADPGTAQPKKKKKWLIPVIIAGAGSLLLIGLMAAIFIFVFGNRKVPVDINEYLQVNFSGYDGYGEADWTLDKTRFLEDYGEKLKYKGKNGQEGMTAAELVLNAVYPSLSEMFELSNGQDITVAWDYVEELSDVVNVELSAEPKTITVSGLQEVQEFDPFETLEITYSGYNGTGRVSEAKFTGTDPVYEDLYLDYDYYDYEGLKNGDEITFSMDLEDYMREYLVSEYGMVPSVTEKTVTVEGLSEVESFDPFEGVEVVFAGMSGSGYVDTINIDNADPLAKEIYFEHPYEYTLKNGDEVVISIDEDYYSGDWFVDNYGKAISTFEKTYVVSGLPGYYTDLSEIPAEEIDAINSGVVAVYRDEIMPEYKDMGFTLVDMMPLGAVLMTKENAEDYTSYDNILYLFYQMEIAVEGSDNVFVYEPVYLTDVEYDETGAFNYEFNADDLRLATSEKVHLENDSYYLDIRAYDSTDAMTEVLLPETDSRNAGMIEAGSTLSVG